MSVDFERDNSDSSRTEIDGLAFQFSRLLRDLMRAAVADDPQPPLERAVDDLQSVCSKLVSREETDYYQLLAKSINFLSLNRKAQDPHQIYISTAIAGTKYLLERSCYDEAAVARATKAYNDFFRSLKIVCKDVP